MWAVFDRFIALLISWRAHALERSEAWCVSNLRQESIGLPVSLKLASQNQYRNAFSFTWRDADC